MTFKRHIPNFITLLNLLSGTIAVFFAVKEQLVLAGLFVFLGIFFDFFDGLAARLLNVQGELGKQLDSLADVVTSGVVPGIILFQLIANSLVQNGWSTGSKFLTEFVTKDYFNSTFFISIIGLIFTLAAAYRLAKFNIDERQTSSFIGLPTPAATLVVISLPFILEYSTSGLAETLIGNTWFLIILTMLLAYFMNAEIPLFSLKFKNLTWKENKIKFIFLGLTVLSTIIFKFLAIPIVIVLYVLLSLVSKK